MLPNDTPRTKLRETALQPAAAEHGARVHAHLSAQIAAAGGYISFERFMDLALYAPGFGYYSGGAQKLGPDGDFVTAPEVSPLFGSCLAVQCAEILPQLSHAVLCEIGAGSGRLAVDLLLRLESLGELPTCYYILEISADLRERQRALLQHQVPHLLQRVRWLDSPPADCFEGIVVANEVLDALPVARFRWRGAQLDELGVVSDGGDFVWSSRNASAEMMAACSALAKAGGGWDPGYCSEYCPRLGPWTRSVVQSLRRGAVIWADYGLPRAQYYIRERHEGTLLCHFRHRAHDDPLLNAGLQDITAWVDFTALAEAADACGCEVSGFTTQAHFLAGCGIDREMHRLAAGDDNRFARLANQARQLMLPGEMGERFKLMLWSRGIAAQLRGFALHDLRHSL